MRDFKKLIVWQKSFALFLSIHRFSKKLPPEERYELGSQIRRAGFSMPSNIAEGSAKRTNAHKRSFLEISLGSAFELETAFLGITELYPHLNLNQECEKYVLFIIEIQKMLTSLIDKLAEK